MVAQVSWSLVSRRSVADWKRFIGPRVTSVFFSRIIILNLCKSYESARWGILMYASLQLEIRMYSTDDIELEGND